MTGDLFDKERSPDSASRRAARSRPSADRESYRDGFPGHHAGDESETSYAAAKEIAPRAKILSDRVLSSLRDAGPASSTQLPLERQATE